MISGDAQEEKKIISTIRPVLVAKQILRVILKPWVSANINTHLI